MKSAEEESPSGSKCVKICSLCVEVRLAEQLDCGEKGLTYPWEEDMSRNHVVTSQNVHKVHCDGFTLQNISKQLGISGFRGEHTSKSHR